MPEASQPTPDGDDRRRSRRRHWLVVAAAAIVAVGTIGWFAGNAVGTWACRYNETREGRPFLKHEFTHIDDLPDDLVPIERSIRYVESEHPDGTVVKISECNPSRLGRSRDGRVFIGVAGPSPADISP